MNGVQLIILCVVCLGIYYLIARKIKKNHERMGYYSKSTEQESNPNVVEKPKVELPVDIGYDFHLHGITHDNEDGSSRQEYLKALYNKEEPFTKPVKFRLEESSYDGKPSVKVFADDYMIGFAPANAAKYVIKLMNEHPNMRIGCRQYVMDHGVYGMEMHLRWNKNGATE